ncbi:MAG: chromosomal replication initiator DnaA [Caulobacterales bacterium]|nr:chromosomal replication initiator DnaA [Caulobacterales bacterium]
MLAQRAEDEASARLAANVASYALGVSTDVILRLKRGKRREAFARQVAMYLCHVGFELSLQRVAIAFGRDRSTVAHACHVIEDKREDDRFEFWIRGLELMLRRAPPSHQRRTPEVLR